MRARIAFAALLLMLPLAARAADPLGTLLTTPEERERLERLRRGEPEPAAGGGPGRITGFVKRSDGRDTLWVDGVPMSVSASRAARLLEPSAVRAYADRKDERLHIERRPPR
jgi:hypothetical protein